MIANLTTRPTGRMTRLARCLCPLTCILLSVSLTPVGSTGARAQEPATDDASISEAIAESTNDASNQSPPTDTLVLVAPLASKFAFLINANDDVLHQWKFDGAGFNAYLFPDGTLMRMSTEPETKLFDARGSAGRIQKVAWDGTLLWDFKYANDDHLQHHDFEVLPNGNVLLIAWEKIPKQQVLEAGRDPEKFEADSLYSEKVVEIRPEGLTGGSEVWVWRLWEHLVQNFDSELPNFGEPREHPRRADLNYVRDAKADWIHMNAVDYHADLDQIIVSPRWFDELWIIDHSTTTEEAASSEGGRYGHGGDLLYRMGNPMSYGHGSLEDKLLFGQHNCTWIPEGFPGAGHVTVFNNGTSPPRTGYSSFEQFKLPVDDAGVYTLHDSGKFESPQVVWSYSRGEEMYSFRISGAERLASGNTLICSGDQPWILEISPDKDVVWETRHRYGGGEGESDKFENGAMFRAPGYTMDYFQASIQEQLRAAQ